MAVEEHKHAKKRWSLLKVIEISLSVTLIILLAMYLFQSRRRGDPELEKTLGTSLKNKNIKVYEILQRNAME